VRIEVDDGKALEFVQGDLTRETTDAIVNAANSSLAGGGGVDGAIHRAGGPEILEECRRWVARHGTLPAGQVMSTAAGRMSARYVLHTVGPVWHGGEHGEPELLASCYREAVALADRLELESVAFPSVSTGVYGYPVAQAAAIAVAAAGEALRRAQRVRRVRWVLFSTADFETYTAAGHAWSERRGPQHE
jgi:O-acetyl-ADP-ribose deacetylase (regulator of RNase III)